MKYNVRLTKEQIELILANLPDTKEAKAIRNNMINEINLRRLAEKNMGRR